MKTASPRAFKDICRQWREYRKLSQLELALAAEVSQRHVSWLETGRSQPSREMVLRLAGAMDIPLRERNVLLHAAGFAPVYRETSLDEPTMTPVLEALTRVLDHHEPLPALVIDRLWNVRLHNRATEQLLSLMGDPSEISPALGAGAPVNLALMTLHPNGLRRYIRNWEAAAPEFIRRLKREAMASGDPEVQVRFTEFIEMAGEPAPASLVTEGLLPVLPLELEIDGLRLSLFSVMSTFGTPQDITTDELRIEAFYPSDAPTAEFFRRTATSGSRLSNPVVKGSGRGSRRRR